MKILPLVNTIKNDVAVSGTHLRVAAHDGLKIASRTAKVYHQNNLKKYYNAARCISDKLIKNTKKEEIPYIAGAIGVLLPIPLTSPILMGLGFILRFSIPDKAFDEDYFGEEKNKRKVNKIV